jgi:hypothetical protein
MVLSILKLCEIYGQATTWGEIVSLYFLQLVVELLHAHGDIFFAATTTRTCS